ncbi:MAG: hypothetical protein M1814_002712 [Vezdaea aestivalis]|nr:MAG: hypothetical protein M1814_002712 [Vezdaea aestivalis]
MAFHDLVEGELTRNTSLLRKHKILPRRTPGQYPDHSYLYSPSTSSLESEESTSSSPHLLASLATDLPPTPPSNRTSGIVTTSHQINGSNTLTPPIHKSPPTPDDTPPRQSLARTHLKSVQALRHAASATESFRTAVEEQPASEAGESSIVSHRPGVLNHAINMTGRAREVGLGLGLESEVDFLAPRSPELVDVVSFQGNWGQDLVEVGRRETISDQDWAANLMKNVTIRKKRRDRRLSPPSTRSSLEMDPRQLHRGLSLRERIERKKGNEETASMENFAETISWPRERLESPVQLDIFDADVRRFSGVSSNSTVVREAIVVNPAPSRQRTLRHSRKNVELRGEASKEPDPDADMRTSHRLKYREGRLPERNFHFVGDLEADNIPVVVIPERQSSLRRKAAFTLDRHLRSQSTASAARNRVNQGGYFDMTSRKRRNLSESGLQQDSVRTVDFPPTIPKRSSSLSAPTSRANSRAASMTSASLHSRPNIDSDFIPRQPSPDEKLTQELAATPEPIIEALVVRPASVQKTPFSIASSTPEALEVSQARAVNFYPHTNHSVNLVIQTNSRPTTSVAGSSHPQMDPSTPPLRARGIGLEVDSPLKNPRRPPEPPQFMVIPPTPANSASPPKPTKDFSTDCKPELERSDSKGPLSRVRRALSQRNRSDVFVRQFPRLRSLPSVRGRNRRKPTVLVEKKPTTLHPLWRPRAFWDSFDDEAEGEVVVNEDFLDRGWTPWLENSLPARGRRFSNAYEPMNATNRQAPIRRMGWFRRLSYSDDTKRPVDQKDVPIGPRMWNSMHARLRDGWERRSTKGIERKRSQIWDTISGPKPVQPGQYNRAWEDVRYEL